MILPDWFWHLHGHKVIGQNFDKRRINPASYDTTLHPVIRLQRYRGVEYPDTLAFLIPYEQENLKQFRSTVDEYIASLHATGDILYEVEEDGPVLMHFHDPHTGKWVNTTLPFQPGDSVLADLNEQFRVPKWVRLQGMLKSSPAREGIDHRAALYVDPGFQGSITLELRFDRTGWLIPYQPIIQFEAQLSLSLRAYKGHYQKQQGVSPNRNKNVAFQSHFTFKALQEGEKSV